MATSMGKVSFANFLKSQGFQVFRRATWLQLQRFTQTAAQVRPVGEEQQKVKPPDIVIPRKKKRDSLSVLKCLASTVQRDPTAACYIFLDDPFLIPKNVNEKRVYAASKAAGRRAARYIIDNYPESFVTDIFHEEASVPYVKAFMPEKIKYEIHETGEEALKERIEMRRVIDSIKMYDDIKQQGLELSEETHLSLLHLLTVFNNKEPEQQLYTEDFRMRRRLQLDATMHHRTWQKDCAAERVFEDLPVKTPEAYCSMIKGLAKYLEAEKAIQFLDEMISKDMPIDVETFNMVIGVTHHKYLDNEPKWEKVVEIMRVMQERSVRPNIDTFKQVFHILKTCSLKFRQTMVFKVLNEVKESNLEPSLGILSMVIDIVYHNNAVTHPFLYDLMDYMKDRKYEFVHKEDYEFFATAMGYCQRNLHDIQLAKKIDDFLNTDDNYKFMGDIIVESAYSKKYFSLVSQFQPIDEIMELYHRLVPNCWTPNYISCSELFNAVDLHDGFQYLPEIWSDLVRFEYLVEDVLSAFFEIIAKKQHEPELQDKFADMIDELVKKFTEDLDKVKTVNRMNGKMIGYFIIIKLQANRFEEAWEMLELYRGHKRHIPGLVSEHSVQMLVDECIKLKALDKAMKCLQFMANEQFQSLKEYKQKVIKEMELTELEREHVEIIS